MLWGFPEFIIGVVVALAIAGLLGTFFRFVRRQHRRD